VGLCSVGKNSEGIRQGARAVLKGRRTAPLWHTLGHLQLALGKFSEALDCFKQAASLNPEAVHREALAVCYQRMGLIEEALAQVEALRNTEDAPFDRYEVFSRALRGETTEAVRLLEAALDAERLSQASLQHDANLNTLLDPALIAQSLQRHRP
jgi:tetratricopeptide (TPR) repeat protein